MRCKCLLSKSVINYFQSNKVPQDKHIVTEEIVSTNMFGWIGPLKKIVAVNTTFIVTLLIVDIIVINEFILITLSMRVTYIGGNLEPSLPSNIFFFFCCFYPLRIMQPFLFRHENVSFASLSAVPHVSSIFFKSPSKVPSNMLVLKLLNKNNIRNKQGSSV